MASDDKNQVYNPLSLFNMDGSYKKIYFRPPYSRSIPRQSMAKDDFDKSKRTETGKNYVEFYKKEEERKLLEAAKLISKHENGPLDQVSLGVPQSLSDVDIDSDNLNRLYRTYNFEYRPKSNMTIINKQEHIISMIENNAVVVLQGPTGCGKTTQVPQMILDSCFRKKQECKIIVTQPRRLAAITIASRVAKERKWPLGSLVGYTVGMLNSTCKDTRLTYCTTGVLLHKLINTKHMLDYTHIILDEVHERDQDLDFLMLVVRKLLRTNSRNVKVILMSATFNVDKFADYFSIIAKDKFIPAPVIEIAKRNYFNVNIYYIDELHALGEIPTVSSDDPRVSRKMMTFCLSIAITLDTLDRTDSACDSEVDGYKRPVILIFLPGIYEIEEMYSIFSEKARGMKWDLSVLHSSITNEEQQKVFQSPPSGHRRIIFSTNIAESSITVPDVKYVIDFCLTKQLVTDQESNFQCLELTWASKANCEQRAGRTGRVMDGRVYRLVPKIFYETVLPTEAVPEILRAPLENVVLHTKMLDMGEPREILALSLDPPDLENLETTILSLKEVGALLNPCDGNQQFDGELTDLGRTMARLPLDIRISKMIIMGHILNVLSDCIVIGASMSLKNMFSTPFQKKLTSYEARVWWARGSDSDCVAFLNVYDVWKHEKANKRIHNNATEREWASQNYIQIRVLREVKALVTELTERLKRIGVTETVGPNKIVYKGPERLFAIQVAIAGGFYPNYFVRAVKGGQMDEKDGVKLLNGLDPFKTVYLQGWPLNQPGKLYAKRIQRYFEQCANSQASKVKIFFDGSSRVFVKFHENPCDDNYDDNSRSAQKITPAIYKAIKMRKIGSDIMIPVMNEKVARQRAMELNLHKDPSNVFENVTTSVMPPLPLGFKPQLPGLSSSYERLMISHVINPGRFWARLRTDENIKMFQKVQNIIETVQLINISKQLSIGRMVIAPYRKSDLLNKYRATIENYCLINNEKMVDLFYIDYGYTGKVRCDEIKLSAAQEELENISALAFQCTLCNVRPSFTYSISGDWCDSATELFMNLIKDKAAIFGDIYSVVNSVVALTLYKVDTYNSKININKTLIDKGYAYYAEESYLSRYNHELRLHPTDLTLHERMHFEKMQYDDLPWDHSYPDPPADTECFDEVRLKGPFSPLELELTSLTYGGKAQKVSIDHTSVNSVLLDTAPGDTYERLLVAGFVGQSKATSNITLRNTTLMPDLPGLAALLTMIFCPQMELRRNQKGNCYIGALCGLGYDPATKAPLYAERDLEVLFDVEFSLEDIQNINKIRYWINVCLMINSEDETENMDQVLKCQDRVKDILFQLVNVPRKRIIPDSDPMFGKWERYPETIILRPQKNFLVVNGIYKLHNALELEKRDAELEEMLVHLSELRDLAGSNTKKEIYCKLCDEVVYGAAFLRSHLFTRKHRENVDRLMPHE